MSAIRRFDRKLSNLTYEFSKKVKVCNYLPGSLLWRKTLDEYDARWKEYCRNTVVDGQRPKFDAFTNHINLCK